MTEETVTPQLEEVVEKVEVEEPEAVEAAEEPVETKVPVSALQKERRKRQELEIENRLLREQQFRKPEPVPEQDDSRYENVTREDLNKHESTMLRKFEESKWIRENPERFEKVNELLPEFLKRRPNLGAAIAAATNRYEEAWELMDKLSPKEVAKITKVAQTKKEAPGSPASIPKAASLNETVDIMNMSDREYLAWRQSKRKAR